MPYVDPDPNSDRKVEDLDNGRVRVTDTDIFTGKAWAWTEPAPTLEDAQADAAECLALRDEFESLLNDFTAPNRANRLLEIRARFLTLRTLYHLATTTEDEG